MEKKCCRIDDNIETPRLRLCKHNCEWIETIYERDDWMVLHRDRCLYAYQAIQASEDPPEAYLHEWAQNSGVEQFFLRSMLKLMENYFGWQRGIELYRRDPFLMVTYGVPAEGNGKKTGIAFARSFFSEARGREKEKSQGVEGRGDLACQTPKFDRFDVSKCAEELQIALGPPGEGVEACQPFTTNSSDREAAETCAEELLRVLPLGNLDVQVMRKGNSTESRGFGFVGYEHPASAGRAVEGMMGFKTAEGKFLKTSHKKGEEAWAGQMILPGHHLAPRPAIKVPPPDRHRWNYAAAAGTQEPGQAPLLDETVKNTHETAVQAIQAVLGEALNLERTIPTESWSQYIEHGVQLAAEVAVHQASNQHEESPLATAPVPVDHRRHREAPPQASLRAVPPGANLYIFYVPANWSEDELQDHFGSFGNILSCTVARHADGLSRGFAFVGYDDPASAMTAIEALNGFKTPEGKILQVALKGQQKGGARSSPY